MTKIGLTHPDIGKYKLMVKFWFACICLQEDIFAAHNYIDTEYLFIYHNEFCFSSFLLGSRNESGSVTE